jgi:hypothetical protein
MKNIEKQGYNEKRGDNGEFGTLTWLLFTFPNTLPIVNQ